MIKAQAVRGRESIFQRIGSYILSSSPERLFLLIAPLLVLAFIIITPPFEVPDEAAHFYRAYQVSEFHLVAQKFPHGGYGGYLPASLEHATQALSGTIPFHATVKYHHRETLQYLHQPLDSSHTTAISFTAATTYSPVAYIPQSIGIGIGRLLALSPLALMLLGRLADAIVWVAAVYWAIKLTSLGKWPLFILALMPMSLFMAASLSPDVVLNAAAFLFAGASLALIEKKIRLTRPLMVLLVLCALIIGFVKFVYLPLFFLLLLAPVAAFWNNRRLKYVFVAGLVVVAAVAGLGWSYVVRDASTTAIKEANQSLGLGIAPTTQLKFVVEHPVAYAKVMQNTYLTSNGNGLGQGFVGTLGWLDAPLPLWVVILDYFLIVLAFASIKTDDFVATAKNRGLLLVTYLLIVVGTTSALYLTYSPPRDTMVIGLQGRYFIIPTLLLVPCGANAVKWLTPPSAVMKKIMVSGSIFVAVVALIVVIYRYYSVPFI